MAESVGDGIGTLLTGVILGAALIVWFIVK